MHSQGVDIVDFIYNLLLNYQIWLTETELLMNQSLQSKTIQTSADVNIKKIFDAFIALNAELRSGSRFVLASCAVGAEYQFSQGVSVFLPWTRMALNMIRPDYFRLRFNRRRDWFRFISTYTGLTIRKH